VIACARYRDAGLSTVEHLDLAAAVMIFISATAAALLFADDCASAVIGRHTLPDLHLLPLSQDCHGTFFAASQKLSSSGRRAIQRAHHDQ
jgi:hypothetical protein